MPKPPSLLALLAFLVVLAVFGVVGAKYMLGSHSDATQSQLALAWPQLASMPEPERAFLTELALTCNVVARPAVRADVLDCLRATATGMGPAAAARFERLAAPAPTPATTR
ncbi:hypothetical protein [Massilia yuzhufengensis]|uniref:Uncharacterized protein n=1 Tax=Massilia yuzhufengensis TaxID=1164594 RepID=A0A1I1P7Y3_9BURK|nr:hypothetical protein [Massilia yuzhufengensis]SFD05702.1 hypothetical protein SAMN05216204_11534 [Massilia yuzhufengensis]